MKARVTITLDPEVHRKAKQAAIKKHTTVSALIESLLKAEDPLQEVDLVSEMIGMAKLRHPEPGSDPLYDSLKAKYIRG